MDSNSNIPSCSLNPVFLLFGKKKNAIPRNMLIFFEVNCRYGKPWSGVEATRQDREGG
jgi:hypothetical protein